MSLSNYVGNYGGPYQLQAYSGTFIPTPDASQSLVQNSTTVKLSSISDGTSNTALFSEVLSGASDASTARPGQMPKGKRAHFMASSMSDFGATATAVNAQLAACQALPPTTAGVGGSRGDWFQTYPFYINYGVYNHMGTPNSIACSSSQSGNSWGQDYYGSAPPTSNHSGGVNMCMSDGSVRFVKDSVSRPTWWALGTRSGGEVVSSDSY